MRLLIADDDDVSRLELEALHTGHGHEVVTVSAGTPSWEILEEEDLARLAVFDWLFEKMYDVDVCRWVRERAGFREVGPI